MKGIKKLSFVIILIICATGLVRSQDVSALDDRLLEAAATGVSDSIVSLLNQGARINCTTFQEGMTPLMLASQNGHLETVKVLLLNGANINHQDVDKISALHMAVHFGHVDIAEILVKNGALTNLKDGRGLSPLFYAAAYGDYVMTDMLLFFGAKGTERDESGKTPFLAAIWGNYPDVARLLRKYGQDIQAQDNKGYTALMLAVENHNPEMVDTLLEWGVDPQAINAIGFNALDIAHSELQPKIVERLTQAGVVRSKFPTWETFTIGPVAVLNNDDYLGGLRFAIKDRRFLWALRFSYYQRLLRVPVSIRISPSTDQQLLESRSIFALGFSKEQRIFHPPGRSWMGFRLAVDFAMSFGDYRGSITKPSPEFHIIPETGIKYQVDQWFLFTGYQYHKMLAGDISPHRFVFEVGFNIK